jgi:hypothetical protein
VKPRSPVTMASVKQLSGFILISSLVMLGKFFPLMLIAHEKKFPFPSSLDD